MRMILLAGVVIGVFLRTFGPYLLRVIGGQVEFNMDYFRSAVVGLGLALVTTGLAVPAIEAEMDWGMALWIGITTGYVSQTAVRHVESMGGTK